jgi:hypothetical protein
VAAQGSFGLPNKPHAGWLIHGALGRHVSMDMRHSLVGLSALAAVGCVGSRTSPARLAPAACAASIASNEVTFVFPEVPEQQWPVGQGGGPVEYYWEVSCLATEKEGGLPWRELSLVVRQDSSSTPRELSLKQLVAVGSLEVVNDSTREVGDGAITVDSDPGFRVGTESNRVLFYLRGPETVQRYFGSRPDSTEFVIHGRNEEQRCSTTVRYF